MTKEILKLDAVTKYFPTTSGLRYRPAVVHALEPVRLSVAAGETIGVVGESGSGKSTLGRIVAGLIKPTSGRVLYEGTDITTMNSRQLRPYRPWIQMIFQDAYSSLNPRTRIGAAIGEAAVFHNIVSRANAKDYVSELLDRVGLNPNLANAYPRFLSGGQRQRAVIARALATKPSVLVADEAVSALDVSIQAGVLNTLRRIQQDDGLTVIFISHDLSVVEYMSDRVVAMYLGRVMEVGDATDLYRAPRHPYTRALLSAAPGHHSERIILRGEVPSPIDPPSGCVFRTRCPFAIDECANAIPPLDPVASDHLAACIRDEVVGREKVSVQEIHTDEG